MKSHSESYKAAGVDVTAGYKAVELMKSHVARTMNPSVLSGIGGFGGLFGLELGDMKNPVLVSGTDGVGTKLRLAFLTDRHNTIGIDCVAMCVNDIICCGARPLFFLDYLALGKNVPEQVAEIVSGVAEGCVQSGCALIGGETAEMPGFYKEDEYDLAGFAVGIVDRDKIFDNSTIETGDTLIALASSGVHSNGFSLIRKVFGIDDANGNSLTTELADTLLTPTKIYVKSVLKLAESVTIKAVSHITGGGFFENIPRILPAGKTACINKASIITPPIFNEIMQRGNIPERDMFNTFNMGVGMCLVIDKNETQHALDILNACGENAYVMGEIGNTDDSSDGGVVLC